MTDVNNFRFYTDSTSYFIVERKDGEKEYYIEGYASTTTPDLVGDVVTRQALDSMLSQLKNRNIKVDVEHESWVEGGSPNIIPIGRVVDARIDEKGLWVRAKLNPASEKFDKTWQSVKGKFLDAFSIAYNGVKAVDRVIDGVSRRIITDLSLLNIAITGNPANPDCQIGAVMAKSSTFAMMEEKTMEENTEPVVLAPAIKSVSVEDFEALKSVIVELKTKHDTENQSFKDENVGLQKQLSDSMAQLKAMSAALDTLQLKTTSKELDTTLSNAGRSVLGPLDFIGR